MPYELKKVTSSATADQTDLAYIEQLSQEDVERAKEFLEQHYFGCELCYEIIEDYAIFSDDQDEIVGWITPDGMVSALCDDESISFHISQISEDEEDYWYYAWEDLFSDGPENTEYTWTPTSSAPTQNSAVKFSDSGQTYTQYLAPCAKVSESIDVEDTSIKTEDAPAKPIDDTQVCASEAVEAIVVDNEVSTIEASPDAVVGEEELPPIDYEISALDKPILHANASDVPNFSDNTQEGTVHKPSVGRSSASKKGDSEQKRSVANISETIFAGVAKVVEDKSEDARNLYEEHASESARNGTSSCAANVEPFAHDATRDLRTEVMAEEKYSGDITYTKVAKHAKAYDDVILTSAKSKGDRRAPLHSTIAGTIYADTDPFAIASAHAAKGGPPYFSHLTSPDMVSSRSEMVSREMVEPARHSDGHNERQGHDRDSDGQKGSSENGSFDDEEEDDGVFC